MNISMHSDVSVINKIADALQKSECVLLGAGAGLSAAAGIDYTDNATFFKLFPKWAEKGYKMQYEFIGFEDWTESEKWAYWATHVNYVFYEFPPSPVYKKLHDIVRQKDFYVITSNADGLFIKSGFETDRVFQAQGNYSRMKCTKDCTSETWDTKPIIDRVLANIDKNTFSVKDPSALPVCPHCGAPLFIAFREKESYNQEAESYIRWLDKVMDKKLFVLEIGVGFNTPGVIRWPFEKLAHSHSDAFFVRVNANYRNYTNTAHPEIPSQIRQKSISINDDAGRFIDALHERIFES